MRLEGLYKLKKSNGLIGTRTRDLPACSIAPQPNSLLRAPVLCKKPSNNRWIRYKTLLKMVIIIKIKA
jgi:hypothetical protein